MKCTEPCCAGRWRKRFFERLRLVPPLMLTIYGAFSLSFPWLLVGFSLLFGQWTVNGVLRRLDSRPWY